MGGVFLLLSKISFYGTTLILVILVLVLSLKFNKKTEEKINDEVSDEYIASYFDGEYQSEIPGKDDGYVVDKIVCDNGATATWDNEDWGINIRNAVEKIKCSIYFKFQFEQDFDYTGTEQVLTIPKTGIYKLEVWGAQGSSNLGTEGKTSGGYGGYSVGFINMKNNDNIYINVGQNYNYTMVKKAAYNGGGYGDMPGGGATHIALSSGELYNLENFADKVVIVAGGGGGEDTCYNWPSATGTIVSGSGGGFKGVDSCLRPGYGGTQSSGGSGYNNGTFGKGGDSGQTDDSGGGGGGGYYGGGSGSDGYYSSGGGGSGYIGNSLLTNKVMYCYNCEESSEESTKTISTTCVEETPTANCSKKGNGYARITYIG